MATVEPIRKRSGRGPLRAGNIVLGIVFLIIAVHVFLDRLYAYKTHAALGYGSIYLKNMVFEICTRYSGAILYLLLALWLIRPLASALPKAAYRGIQLLVGFLGWVIGYGLLSLNATDWFLFFNHLPFGQRDPLLHADVAFYTYSLPIITGIVGRLIFTCFLIAASRLIYFAVVFVRQQFVSQGPPLFQVIRRHARLLLWYVALIFLGFAVLAYLNRYDTMLQQGGTSFLAGPDFITAKLTLPIFSWISIALLVLTAGSIAWLAIRVETLLPDRDGFVIPSFRQFKRPIRAFGAYIAMLIIGALLRGAVASLYVHPNQNTVELPYIQDSISATRWALGLNKVQYAQFTPASSLTAAAVQRDDNAVNNVRVNDIGQTTDIYNQLQSFKSYFQFQQASVDRYNNNEVYVAARQMNVNQLPVQTWVNQTLVYTHGYGLAASPVNQFDTDGLPTFLAKDTPQTTLPPMPKVTRPQIYFGTMNNDVIAPSKQPEFDYPVGSQSATSHYQGGYGLPIQGNRLLLALEQGTLRFYTSDQLTSKSEWLFDRNIYTRVQDIAPFLRYDNDAFPFVDNSGHILWMLDAYTSTPMVPYAQTFMGTSYIRNSVKVVMDAYTGKTTFYVVDPSDPMLQSLERIYPNLFTSTIPSDVRAHFRYPTDLFQAQSTALTRYHMTDPSAFYNQEDLWAMAHQIYTQNQVTTRPPVYQMIRMPDQTTPHFVISSLFTPSGKDNLNGWFVADNKPASYGKLTLYQFPQSSLIFGPMQAENQIDADPTISQQLTLWNQQGSQVVRGDLLLVPIGDAILYIEPVYLVANRQNSLPQLERVIIDFNKQVYIDTSLGAAMQDLLNGSSPTTPQSNLPGGTGTGTGQGGTGTGTGTGQGGTGVGTGTGAGNGTGVGVGVGGVTEPTTVSGLAAQANQLLQQYQLDTSKGDFVAAGNDLKQLGTVLAQLQGSTQPSAAKK